MASRCKTCGTEVGLKDQLLRDGRCVRCDEDARAAKAAARGEYAKWMDWLAHAPEDLTPAKARLPALTIETGYEPHELQALSRQALARYCETALADEILDETEESRLINVAELLGFDNSAMSTQLPGVMNRLVVSRVNDGRLPEIEPSGLILKNGEVGHAECPAQLMKEVSIRQYQGGYGGFSIPIAKGVRFHTGSMRGQSVIVGTEMQVADDGLLVVTSTRAVFIGSRSTSEFAYKKLLSLQMYADGIQFHVSNRKTAPLFRLPPDAVDAIGATVNAAAQRCLE